MNLEHLQQKLIAAARATPPDDRVPYAFEQRILARLAERPVADAATLWARALWRAAVPCVAVTLLVAACSFVFVSSESNPISTDDVSEQFEQALLATADSGEELP